MTTKRYWLGIIGMRALVASSLTVIVASLLSPVARLCTSSQQVAPANPIAAEVDALPQQFEALTNRQIHEHELRAELGKVPSWIQGAKAGNDIRYYGCPGDEPMRIRFEKDEETRYLIIDGAPHGLRFRIDGVAKNKSGIDFKAQIMGVSERHEHRIDMHLTPARLDQPAKWRIGTHVSSWAQSDNWNAFPTVERPASSCAASAQ